MTHDEIKTLTQTLDQIVLARFKPIENEMSDIKNEITGFKKDMGTVKEGIGGIKNEMLVMKQEITGIKKEMSSVKSSASTIKKDLSETRNDVKVLISYFDRDYVNLRKRIEIIEEHLGIPSTS